MKTLVLSGSIRSSNKSLNYVSKIVEEVNDLTEYIACLKAYIKIQKNSICNSDFIAGVAMLSMRLAGADIDHFSLPRLFPHQESKVEYNLNSIIDPHLTNVDTLSLDSSELQSMLNKIFYADGIILSTPVYFGDRSSVANKVLQISGMKNFLKGKVFGTIAVGAKRNGGQETTIVNCLMEALNQNAIFVGNGPPTSQYGGTVVGGHKGTGSNDEWGLTTVFGTGQRVSHVSNLIKQGKECFQKRVVKILLLVTMDIKSGALIHFLEKILTKVKDKIENVEFELYNVLNKTIYRCLGCNTCPDSNKQPDNVVATIDDHSFCIIKNPEDGINDIHEKLLDSDGLVIAGLNVKEHSDLIYRYQVLVERTRFIRRNNFELTDMPMTAFTLTQVGSRINSFHSVKTVTSYIRHNSIMVKPIEAFVNGDEVIEDGSDDLINFVRWTQVIASGREKSPRPLTQYSTEGIGGY